MPSISLNDLLDEFEDLLISFELENSKDKQDRLSSCMNIRHLIKEILSTEDYLGKDQIEYLISIDRNMIEEIKDL